MAETLEVEAEPESCWLTLLVPVPTELTDDKLLTSSYY